MASKKIEKQPIFLLKIAFGTLIDNPIVLFPYGILAFIQLLIFELIFFAPRQPLSFLFKPLISRVEGDLFLHYPFNFLLLVKWFQSAWVQVPVYIIFSSFLLGATIGIINRINNDKKVKMGDVFAKTFASYIHLIVVSIIAICVLFGLTKLLTLIISRAAIIRSTSGAFFIIKQTVLIGAPYYKLFVALFVSAIFSLTFPSIIIEKKKVFSALLYNFKNLWGNFWFVFIVFLLPGLLYVPIILLKTNTKIFEIMVPEVWGGLIILGMLLALLIDALQYTAITTFYLLKKEAK